MTLIEKMVTIKAARIPTNERDELLNAVNLKLDTLGFDVVEGEKPGIDTFDRLSPLECKEIINETIPERLPTFTAEECKDAITILLYTDLAPIRTVGSIARGKLKRRVD